MKTYIVPAIDIQKLNVSGDILLDGTLSVNDMNTKPTEDLGGDDANVSPIWDE